MVAHNKHMNDALRMSPGEFRNLTAGEMDLAESVFGPALDASRVRIFAMPVWNRAFVTGGRLVVWPTTSALKDFSTASLHWRSVLVHEMTHVWQAQSGVNLILAKIAAGDGNRAYAYDLSAPCGFEGLNIEQQAMIVQDAYLARHGAETPFETHVYSEVLANWPGSIFSNPHPV